MNQSVLWCVRFLLAGTLLARGADAFRLVILHTNDMHARLEEVAVKTGPCSNGGPCYGGFSRIAAAVKELKSREPDSTIFLNAGDSFQGTPYYYVFKWRIMAEVIDRLGIDVMSLGNHEFDDGPEGLDPYLRTVKTPSVAANVDFSKVPYMANGNIRPSYNLYINGVNISIIGYITPDTKFLARPEPVKFTPEIPILQKLAREAKRDGAKIVIGLGHSGFPMDKKIAEAVEDIDVIVGGHTDTFLYTGTPPDIEVPESTYPHMVTQKSGKQVPVVQAFGYTKYLGHLELEFDDDFKLTKATGNPILLDSSKPQDPAVLNDILMWKRNMSAQLDEVVGRTVVDLEGACRAGECNMGNFFADAIVDHHVREVEGLMYENGWTNAPIGVMNGGSIRASLYLNDTQGNFTQWDILTVVPFDNKMVRVTVDGKLLKEILEKSIDGYNVASKKKGKGGFLQVSGLKVTYDLSKPRGKQVVRAEARCGACRVPTYEPLNMTAMYSVILSEYIVQGGDGYYHFQNISEENQEKLDWTDLDAIKAYATKTTPFYPSEEGRITVLLPGSTSVEVEESEENNAASSMSNLSLLLGVVISLIYLREIM